jgi:hypothetical protein
MNDDNFRLERNPLGESRKKRRQFWQMLMHLGVIPSTSTWIRQRDLSAGILTLLRLPQKLE